MDWFQGKIKKETVKPSGKITIKYMGFSCIFFPLNQSIETCDCDLLVGRCWVRKIRLGSNLPEGMGKTSGVEHGVPIAS